MRSTTLTTLLLPLLLSVVLAVPTPVAQIDPNSSVKNSDDCGVGPSDAMEVCYLEHIGDDDRNRLPDNSRPGPK